MTRNLTIRNLEKHPRADAMIEIEHVGDGIVYRLQSYCAPLAYVNEFPDGWSLDCYPIHSATERRHIEWFFEDIHAPFTIDDAKRSAETGRAVYKYKS